MTPEPLPGDALRRARLQQTYAKVENTGRRADAARGRARELAAIGSTRCACCR